MTVQPGDYVRFAGAVWRVVSLYSPSATHIPSTIIVTLTSPDGQYITSAWDSDVGPVDVTPLVQEKLDNGQSAEDR